MPLISGGKVHLVSDEWKFGAPLIRWTFIAKSPPKNQMCTLNQAAPYIIRPLYQIITVLSVISHTEISKANPYCSIFCKTFSLKKRFEGQEEKK